MSAGKALRLPSENELFGNATQDVNAAPDLKPEESHNINLGVDFKPNMESTETKGIDAELFYNYSDKFNMRFSLSKFDVLFNTKYDINGRPYSYYRTQIPNEPSFKFNGNASYTFKNLLQQNSRLSLNYNVNYVQTIPTQVAMDLGLTCFFPCNKVA